MFFFPFYRSYDRDNVDRDLTAEGIAPLKICAFVRHDGRQIEADIVKQSSERNCFLRLHSAMILSPPTLKRTYQSLGLRFARLERH